MHKTFAVIGASGLVGSALVRELTRQKKRVIATFCNHPIENGVYLDIEDRRSVRDFFKRYRPNIVFLPASIPHVDRCEVDRSTDNVNIYGLDFVISCASSIRAQVVFFSSGYVFDGISDKPIYPGDIPSPLNKYGLQKRELEIIVNQTSNKNIVIRTIGVFGKEIERKNFVYQVYDSLTLGKTLYAPYDQFMNPIFSDDLARYSVDLVEMGRSGFFHIAGDTCLSKYAFALVVANTYNLPVDLVVGINSATMRQAAKRPVHCCLMDDNIKPPNFSAGLEKFKRELL